MSLLAPRFADPELVPVGDWRPARYTASLSGTEDFPTDADRLLEAVAKHWRSPEVARFLLDPWQVWLLRHALELYPDDWPREKLRGQLRYRQVVISLARQNGKSILGALLAFYFLTMHVRGPRVVGLASVDRQARIVYDRVKYAIDNDMRLTGMIKTTATRGITLRNGTGIYQTLPADEDSAQGEPVSGCIYDELHIGMAELWDAIIKGQTARENSLMVGITTAGDQDSDLLIRLYAEGKAAIEGQDERFGFFVWEADSDEVTEANVIRANPAVACGRLPLEVVMSDARKLWKAPKDKRGVSGRDRVIRYTLNRFLEGSATAWASAAAWRDSTGEPQHTADVVYALERTPDWSAATVTATSSSDGIIHTEVVATLLEPDHDQLVAVAEALATRGSCAFAMDRTTLGEVARTLKDNGLEVWSLNATEKQQAAATAKATIARRAVVHPGDPIVREQFGKTKRRDTPEGWRISVTLSTGDVDAVQATVWGLYVATVRPQNSIQLW